jgi:hypothetical protein
VRAFEGIPLWIETGWYTHQPVNLNYLRCEGVSHNEKLEEMIEGD